MLLEDRCKGGQVNSKMSKARRIKLETKDVTIVILITLAMVSTWFTNVSFLKKLIVRIHKNGESPVSVKMNSVNKIEIIYM